MGFQDSIDPHPPPRDHKNSQWIIDRQIAYSWVTGFHVVHLHMYILPQRDGFLLVASFLMVRLSVEILWSASANLVTNLLDLRSISVNFSKLEPSLNDFEALKILTLLAFSVCNRTPLPYPTTPYRCLRLQCFYLLPWTTIIHKYFTQYTITLSILLKHTITLAII